MSVKPINWLAALLVLSLAACSTSPSSVIVEPETPTESLLTSEEIGSNGGIIDVGDFVLSVPSGSFTESTVLELFEVAEDQQDNDATQAYSLKGLPTSYDNPLKLRIKHQSNLTGETFVAVGEDVFVSGQTQLETRYNYFPANIVGDFLEVELPATEPILVLESNLETQNSVTEFSISIRGRTSQGSLKSAAGHFNLNYPVGKVALADVQSLAGFLEEAYDRYKQMGFSYSKRTNWPVTVNIRDLGDNAYGFQVNSRWGHNYGWMEFNSRLLSNTAELRVTAGHEFFHIVQSFYDSRNAFSRALFAPPHYWLNEATAVWAEALFSSQSSYNSAIRNGNEFEPFRGVYQGVASTEKATQYGYGMSALAKYLVQRYGESILVDIYSKIYKDGLDPVKAIDQSLKNLDHIFTIYEPFLRDYVLGNLYTMKADDIAGLRSSKFDIRSEKDVSTQFSAKYGDLSGKLYSVLLRFPNINPAASLKLTVDGEFAAISVFRYNSARNQIEFIDFDQFDVIVPNLKDLTDNKWQLLVMVSNNHVQAPYATQRTIDLNIEVLQENLAPEVDAGTSQNLQMPGSVLLSGSVNDDGLPNPPNEVKVTWSKVSGPGNVSFQEARSLSTYASFSESGTYVLELIATDGEKTNSDRVTIIATGTAEEICGDGLDNDGDNKIDEDCDFDRQIRVDDNKCEDDVIGVSINGSDLGSTPRGKERFYDVSNLDIGEHTLVITALSSGGADYGCDPNPIVSYGVSLDEEMTFISRDGSPFSFSGDSGEINEGTSITYIFRVGSDPLVSVAGAKFTEDVTGLLSQIQFTTTLSLDADFAADAILGGLSGVSATLEEIRCFFESDPDITIDVATYEYTDTYTASFSGDLDSDTGNFNLGITPAGTTTARVITAFDDPDCIDLNDNPPPGLGDWSGSGTVQGKVLRAGDVELSTNWSFVDSTASGNWSGVGTVK